MTQEKLAELSGLNYKYIGRVELGKADAGAEVLVRLARGLAVTVGDLFDTITPATNAPRLLPVRDVEHITTALQELTSAIDRLFATHRAPAAKPPRRPGS